MFAIQTYCFFVLCVYFISQVSSDSGSTSDMNGENNGGSLIEDAIASEDSGFTWAPPDDYDNKTRPGTPGTLLDVNCSVYVTKLGPFSDRAMTFFISFVLQCWWKDERLPSHKAMVDESERRIWRPLITPVIHADVTKNEEMIYPVVYPGKVVFLTKIYDMRVPCQMHLYTYPHDRQICGLHMSFVGGLKVGWTSSLYLQTESPIAISMTNVRSAFKIEQVDFISYTLNVQSYRDTCIYQSGTCDYSGYADCIKMGVKCFKAENLNTTACIECLQFGGRCKQHTPIQDCSPFLDKVNLVGDFHTTLEFRFALSRLLSYQILHTYVPSSCVVAISWVSFWLDPASAPARTSLGVTTVLTMVTLSTKIGATPEHNYVRAIDIWMLSCKLFVVLALLEYAFVNFAARQASKAPIIPERTDTDENQEDKSFVPNEDSLDESSAIQLPKIKFTITGYNMAKKLDYVSRFLFPTVYIAFVATYFGVLSSFEH
ncbi:glycine receptor subunit alpha-2-like [Branchiostoma lanceolatum]|uniref:glycine receptor subunit alpha-2-like n=1 Tax=Branchiostoma lanceolatum TaxID=7740 RepID=UPI003451CC8A